MLVTKQYIINNEILFTYRNNVSWYKGYNGIEEIQGLSFTFESTPKRQTGRHCEGEARSNLLISSTNRLLRYARNEDKSLFGVDSHLKSILPNQIALTVTLIPFIPLFPLYQLKDSLTH